MRKYYQKSCKEIATGTQWCGLLNHSVKVQEIPEILWYGIVKHYREYYARWITAKGAAVFDEHDG